MKLTKRSDTVTSSQPGKLGVAQSRREFLRNSSLMAGGAALATSIAPVTL